MFALCSDNFMYCWYKGFISKWRNTSTRRLNNDSTELAVKTTTWPLWLSHASDLTGKEGSYCVGCGDWCDLIGGYWIILHNGGKGEYVCNTGDTWGHLLVLACPVIINGKLQQLNPGKTANDSDPTRMKVWVIPPGKEVWPPWGACWRQKIYRMGSRRR